MLVFPNSFSLPKSRCWSQSNTSTSEIPYIVNTPFSLAKSLRLAFRANHLLQRTYLEGCEKIGAANPQTKRWAATNLCWTLVRGEFSLPMDFDCTFTMGGTGEFVRRICCLFDNNLLSILMEVKVYLLGILWKRKFTSKNSFLWEDERILKYLSRSKKNKNHNN